MSRSGIERLIRKSDKAVLMHDGVERRYFTYAPKDLGNSAPAVFILHGGNANGENAMRMANMETLADREGFLLVYPDGAGPETDHVFTWNSGHCCGYAMQTESDDSGFLAALIDYCIEEYGCDAKRMYMAGLSNGAMMTHRFACEHSSKIAAIAAISGAKNFDECMPTDSVSVISFHGTDDKHAPFEGGEGADTIYKRCDAPVQKGIEFWLNANGCDKVLNKEEFDDYTHENYTQAKGDISVEHYIIKGQGHAWPGGKDGIRYGNVDTPNSSVHASALIWDFFKKHKK
ncbi:MAG: polyhydroxybutyrate depolymerase [Candidatus Omnitrophota bacterium]|jgi:polyhydroxybutyrate depolymerase